MSKTSILREKPRSSAKLKLKTKPSKETRNPDSELSPGIVSARTGHAMQQASRMEAMGQLAGGIAHDFNNLLTVILGHSEFLLKRKESPSVCRSRVEEIRKAAERGAWLTSQLLAYSRNQLLEPTVLQINSVVEDMDGMLRCVLGEDIAVELVVDPDLGWTKVDPGQLQQIVLNLAGNARDAMPKGGRLRVETLNFSIHGNAQKPQPFIEPCEYVGLVVQDTGTGIDEPARGRIFEPFFTTKEKGKGTGLGLATVYGIVKQSGGYIWVESELGRGTSFHTLLPRVRPPKSSCPVQERLDFSSGGETILLAEDDPGVRKMSAEVLRNAGYNVLVAAGAADALRLVEEHTGPLDLLLTDVVMPGMTGPELAGRFSVLFPRVQVLYMTGYTDDAMMRHGFPKHAHRLLQKPFTHETLERSVCEALERVP